MTLEQDYSAQRFRVRLDGVSAPIVNPTTAGDSWFTMVGTALNRMSRLRLLGGTSATAAYLDDLVVSTSLPFFLQPRGSVYLIR